MKITRDIAVRILDEMAEEVAKSFGYDQISTNDIDCGFWDMEHLGPLGVSEDGKTRIAVEKGSMSKFLKEKYGEMVEYKYHKAVPDGEEFKSTIDSGNYVGLRYMWGMPCLAIHQNGNSVMGELQIGRKYLLDENGNEVLVENGYHKLSDEYDVSGLHCFKKLGIEYGKMLHKMWNKKVYDLVGQQDLEEEKEFLEICGNIYDHHCCECIWCGDGKELNDLGYCYEKEIGVKPNWSCSEVTPKGE